MMSPEFPSSVQSTGISLGWICDYITTRTSNYTTFAGVFSTILTLEGSELDDLLEDGLLNFTITGTGDNSILQVATMTLDITRSPLSVPVPEPSTIALIGAGILCIVLKKAAKHLKET